MNDIESKLLISASRVGPGKMRPLHFEDKRYEQIMNGEHLGLVQRTGLMAIFDESSKSRIAVIQIYDEPRIAIMEADAGDVFFIRFELNEAKREILIENERHRHFIYSIDGGTVRAM